jgi:radical SAM superfamily enzyme YgiQ (UPF0313 family)
MSRSRQDWSRTRSRERHVEALGAHATYSLALAYPNTYHIGMSSLGFQRTWELVSRRPDWSCERFFTDGDGPPVDERPSSVETDTPLDAFGAIAFSVSFEEDYVNLVRMLDRAGIPALAEDRGERDSLVVMGGSCATINPLPMAPFVDVFALGAAENLLPELLDSLESGPDRDGVLERLAARPGFYVPRFHHPEGRHPEIDGAEPKLHKLDLTAEQMRTPGHLPTTAIVTPDTEFSEKFLVEMSRGCPEKCRYCWATFGMGSFRSHPAEYILGSLERARGVTDQLGFVATAVGDHPEIERILLEACSMGFRTSVSSIRIPAVTEGVLAAIHASGGRSITLAPETGSDELRVKLNKPIPNSLLLDKVRLIFRRGFTQLKLYFIVGLPQETMADVEAILEVARECRAIMLEELAPTGVIGNIHLGTNILAPKPYTGYQRVPMEERASVEAKLALLRKGVARLPNVTMGPVSYRQAVWQTYLSKGGREVAGAILRVARGETVASVLRSERSAVDREVFRYLEGDLRWHFMTPASQVLTPVAAPAGTR